MSGMDKRIHFSWGPAEMIGLGKAYTRYCLCNFLLRQHTTKNWFHLTPHPALCTCLDDHSFLSECTLCLFRGHSRGHPFWLGGRKKVERKAQSAREEAYSRCGRGGRGGKWAGRKVAGGDTRMDGWRYVLSTSKVPYGF